MGARATKPGPSATCYPTGVAAVPVEILEAVMPIIFDRKELRPGSGGAGRSPGGEGQIIQFRMQTERPVAAQCSAEPARPRARGPRRRRRGRGRALSGERQAGERSAKAHARARRRRAARNAGRRRLRPAAQRLGKRLNKGGSPMRCKLPILSAAIALVAAPAGAQDYKIGISAGLTGYAATVDRAWRDGVEVAAATLNAKGGVMGRKLTVVAEDNRSEPQEAVTVYRKMISSDNVNVFISGCVSAGNFAAAPHRRARTNPDGALLDPAAAARPSEMGVQHAAAGRHRSGEAARISQGQDADQEDRRAARSRRPMRGCRRRRPRSSRRPMGSRSSASSSTSRTMPTSASRSAR